MKTEYTNFNKELGLSEATGVQILHSQVHTQFISQKDLKQPKKKRFSALIYFLCYLVFLESPENFEVTL